MAMGDEPETREPHQPMSAQVEGSGAAAALTSI